MGTLFQELTLHSLKDHEQLNGSDTLILEPLQDGVMNMLELNYGC